MNPILNCPRCNAELISDEAKNEMLADTILKFCPNCPKVELYKGVNNYWFRIYYLKTNGSVTGWGMTIPGWAIYSELRDGSSDLYNGHDYLVPIPNPPNDLMYRSNEYVASWIKMMLVFA